MQQRPFTPLFDLLLLLFRTNDDLAQFLLTRDYARAADLVDALPSRLVPRRTYFADAVPQIQAHGLDEPELFTQMADLRPGNAEAVEAALRVYFGVEPPPRQRDADDDRTPHDVGAPPPPALVASFEKLMNERATFLDVAYLAIGYERARSVALLRMRWGAIDFTGTAFLVTPDTLLTAHHNLWDGDVRADHVEVEFDFERSVSGAAQASTVVRVDPATFVGDAADDWALLRLPQPQIGRPLAPLGRNAVVAAGDRVAIIQHPRGMLKQVALHHNLVTHADDARIQYLTDTLPGSSGSPVFDRHWNVVAIHHAGGDLPVPGTSNTVYCNQGIAIQRVLGALSAREIVI
jgi:hypothetical protein